MIQHIIIAVFFFAAVVYLGYLVYRAFQARAGCSSGCGSCGVDFSKIEKQLKNKKA